MITDHYKRNISSCPKIQSVERYRFQLLQGPLKLLKTPIIPFPQHTPQKAQRHHFTNNGNPIVVGSPPTSQPINYSSRHNSRQPESFEEDIPNGTSNLTIKKKMVHRIPILFAHNTPINHNSVPLPKIVYGKDLPWGCRSHKEGHPQ
jgi:hypothetical protein